LGEFVAVCFPREVAEVGAGFVTAVGTEWTLNPLGALLTALFLGILSLGRGYVAGGW